MVQVRQLKQNSIGYTPAIILTSGENEINVLEQLNKPYQNGDYTLTLGADKITVSVSETNPTTGVSNPVQFDINKMDGTNAGLYTKTIHDGIYSDIGKRVVREIVSGVGTAIIFNEASGGGAKYEFNDGTRSYIGVNNDIDDVTAQIYTVDSANKGVRISVKKSGIYYTNGKSDPTTTANDEIATKGDLSKKVDIAKVDGNLKSEISNDGNMIYGVVTYNGDDRTIFQQSSEEISGYVTDGTNKSNLIINKDGTYIQKGSEVGVTIQPGQALVRQDALDKKVDREVTEDSGAKSSIDNQKGLHGTEMKSSFNDTIVAFNTKDNNGEDGILGQIYAKTNSTGNGAFLDIYKDGVYYGKGVSVPHDSDHEIATRKDLREIVVGIFRGEFETKALLDAYSGEKNKNDTASVKSDETHGNVTTMYIYDGTVWKFAYQITNNDCIRLLGNEAVSGLPYNLPYYFYVTPDPNKIVVTAKTIPLDNSFDGPGGTKKVTDYTLDIKSASSTEAGLLSADDKTKLDNLYGLYKQATTLIQDGSKKSWTGILGTFSTEELAKEALSKLADGSNMIRATFSDSSANSTYIANIYGLSLYTEGTQQYLSGKVFSETSVASQEVEGFDVVIGVVAESSQYKVVIKISSEIRYIYIELKDLGMEFPVAELTTDTINKIFEGKLPLKVSITTKDGAKWDAISQTYVIDSTNNRVTADLKVINDISSTEYAFDIYNYAIAIFKTPIVVPGVGNVNAMLERVQQVVDNLTTYDPKKVLSANQGAILNDTVRAISTHGRNIGNWSCVTGLPQNPIIQVGFTYNPYDYYYIAELSGTSTQNLMPEGTTYTGVASTKYDSTEPALGNIYVYLGDNTWQRQNLADFFLDFKNIAGSPTDNPKLMAEFDKKLDKNTSIQGGTNCKITYDDKGLVTGGDALSQTDIPDLASNKTTTMDGYSKATSSSAIATTDSLNDAIGKLEYKTDNPAKAIVTKYAVISTSWTASGTVFKQDISVSGITSSDTPIISFINTGSSKLEVESQQAEASKIYKIDTSNKMITVYATYATTTNLNIIIKLV